MLLCLRKSHFKTFFFKQFRRRLWNNMHILFKWNIATLNTGIKLLMFYLFSFYVWCFPIVKEQSIVWWCEHKTKLFVFVRSTCILFEFFKVVTKHHSIPMCLPTFLWTPSSRSVNIDKCLLLSVLFGRSPSSASCVSRDIILHNVR